MAKLIFPVAVALILGACQNEPSDRTTEESMTADQEDMVDETIDGTANDGMTDAAPPVEADGDRDESPDDAPQANANTNSRPAKAAETASVAPSPPPKLVAVSTAASANATAGGRIYATACVACHGADGKGTIPGVPDFTAAGGRLAKSDTVLLRNITNGVQSPGSPMPMPPKGGNPSLTEQDMANTLAYIRKTFGR